MATVRESQRSFLSLSRGWKALGIRSLLRESPGEPNSAKSCAKLCCTVEGDVTPKSEALIYAADRAHHIATKVRPAIEQGRIVVQDRSCDSSIAYQGVGRGLGADEVRHVSLWATDGLLPDLTVLLDIDESEGRDGWTPREPDMTGLKRKSRNSTLEFGLPTLCLRKPEPERFLVLDATQPVDELAASHPQPRFVASDLSLH